MKKKISKIFSNFVKKTITEKKLDDISQLKLLLISNDVALNTAEEICNQLVERLKGEQIGRLSSIKSYLFRELKEIIRDILTPEKQIDLIEEIKAKNSKNLPYVIVFLGVNGTGKTTTMAKIAHFLKKQGISSVAAASDTFRAGAIEQLSKHMDNVGIRVIKHQYKSDPASVAYDALNHAKAKNINVVLVDTAGRQVTDKNLMVEMQKIIRIAEPDLKVLIVDSLSGNDALFQAKEFKKHVGIDSNVLTKLDADSSGGAALSITHETKKPILFIGNGQSYDDIEEFSIDSFISSILESE